MKSSIFSSEDTRHMARAIQIARRGLYTTHPNPRVGCVIVKDGNVVGEGWHQVAGQGHAEVNAIAGAGAQALGATAYVTLEPCSHVGRTPPCSQALIRAGIARVVSAMEDPNPQVSGNGHRMLQDHDIDVSCGLLEAEARQLNPGFIKRMTSGLPWVRVKSAMSVDGRTAMASGESQWITGPAARQDVQRLRARSEAIITGVQSVLIDDPSLTVRMAGIDPDLQPLRVVLDSQLRTPVSAKMLMLPGTTLIVCAEPDHTRQQALEAAGAEVICLPGTMAPGEPHPRVDLKALLSALVSREVNEVLVETGPTTAGAFMRENLVDEWLLYMAPTLMGSDARPVLSMPGISTMADKISLNMKEVIQVGDDLRITYTVPSTQESQAVV